MPRKRMEESDANFPYQNVQCHSVTSLETARSLANSAFSWNCSVSYLSFVYGRNLWAELNAGKNSLHWMGNMFSLFSIMTLWSKQTNSYVYIYTSII